MDLMNSKGAAGYDGIKMKHLQNIRPTSKSWLTSLLQIWHKLDYIPTFIKFGAIRGIKKKDTVKSPSDFRPISLLPIVFKIYERVILIKLWEHCLDEQLHDLQGGIRRARGVIEQLHVLQIASEQQIQNNEALYAALLDIRKAYDKTWRESIPYKLIYEFKLPIKLIKVIWKQLKKHSFSNQRRHTH